MKKRSTIVSGNPVEAEDIPMLPSRCDRCSAEALVHVVLEASQLMLAFCGHHYHRNEDALHCVASVVYDDRLRFAEAH